MTQDLFTLTHELIKIKKWHKEKDFNDMHIFSREIKIFSIATKYIQYIFYNTRTVYPKTYLVIVKWWVLCFNQSFEMIPHEMGRSVFFFFKWSISELFSIISFTRFTFFLNVVIFMMFILDNSVSYSCRML